MHSACDTGPQHITYFMGLAIQRLAGRAIAHHMRRAADRSLSAAERAAAKHEAEAIRQTVALESVGGVTHA